MLEITDIPVGLRTRDALAKESPVQIGGSGTLHGGNYLLLFCGEVEAVQFAHRKAISICQAHLRDEVSKAHGARGESIVVDIAVQGPVPSEPEFPLA